MNDKKRNRLRLRQRMIEAQTVIFRRRGYAPQIARKMAREFTDQMCSAIMKKESR